MASRWYCRVRDEELGPVTFQDMAEMIRAGTLTEGDRVRRELSEEWIPARDVIGLFRAAKGQPAQSPPNEPEESPPPATAPEAPQAAATSASEPSIPPEPLASAKPPPSPKARRLRRVVLVASAAIVLTVIAAPLGRSILARVPRGVEKEVAQSVLDSGGKVGLIVGDKLVEVGTGGDLPQGRFLVQSVHFYRHPSIDDKLPGLTQLEELLELHIPGSRLGDPAMEHVGKLTKLRALNLAGTSIHDAGLASLAGLTRLRWLDLDGTRVGDPGLRGLGLLPNLNHLLLIGTQVTDDGLKQLAGMRSLCSLDLRATRVTAAGVGNLRKALPNCQVVITPDVEAAIRDKRKLQGADAEQIAAEWVLQCGGTLDVLLRGQKKSVRHAGELPKEAFAITDIYLGDKPMVDDDGLSCLAGLQKLQSLHPYSTRLTSRGLEHLRGITTLEVLNIAYTRVEDGGLKRLAHLRKLRHLVLNQLPIRDAGLEHLKGHTGLQILALAGTRITDKGLQILQTLPSLQEVDLQGTQVSPQAVAALKAARPQCRVLGVKTR